MFEEQFAGGIKRIILKHTVNKKPTGECTGLIDDLSYLLEIKLRQKKPDVLPLVSKFIFKLEEALNWNLSLWRMYQRISLQTEVLVEAIMEQA